MATVFGGSRLANLREKRAPLEESLKDQPAKPGLPDVPTDKISYEPSTVNGRMHTRFLKPRIDRSLQNKQKGASQYTFEHTADSFKIRPEVIQAQTEQLRLTLKDDFPKIQELKTADQNLSRPNAKRVLIARQPERQKNSSQKSESIKSVPIVFDPDAMPEKPTILNNPAIRKIQQEEVEQSMREANETDLVQCTEGCGRKFNRKALQKHAKACKLVFMSKRKEFNSEAKRVVDKQQATIIKQAKAKQKKEGNVRTKVLEKTTDNWKAASKDFRDAVKAIKKDVQQQCEQKDEEQQAEQQMKILPCQFCEKQFASVFLQKHMSTCVARKQQEGRMKMIKKK